MPELAHSEVWPNLEEPPALFIALEVSGQRSYCCILQAGLCINNTPGKPLYPFSYQVRYFTNIFKSSAIIQNAN